MSYKVILASAVLAFSTGALASANPAFEIGSVEHFEITEPTLLNTYRESSPIGAYDCQEATQTLSADMNPIEEINIADAVLDKIINIGKKVWAVVEVGRPVVNFQTDVATALPHGARCWLQLEGWKAPEAKVWGVSMKNMYGSEVVRFVYRVNYVYGGSVEGQGRYIGYATAAPVDMYVAWGWNFSAQASVPTVFNTGTKEAPVAGMQLNMAYTVKTVMNELRQSQAYFVSGDGTFKKLD